MNRITRVAEPLFLNFFIWGLKSEIQRELLIAPPTSLGEAMTKAQLFEERNEDLAGIMRKGSATTPLTINKSEERHYDVSTTQHAYTNSIGALVKLHIKRLTAA